MLKYNPKYVKNEKFLLTFFFLVCYLGQSLRKSWFQIKLQTTITTVLYVFGGLKVVIVNVKI